MTGTVLQTVSLLPVNSRGDILLQLRDDKPGLPYANHWTTIGGEVEAGETVEEALVRETEEEIGFALRDYRPFSIFRGRRREVHVFYCGLDLPVEALTLGEGQAIRFFSGQEALSLRLVPIIAEILRDFIASPQYLAAR